jgi:hypothetical protein
MLSKLIQKRQREGQQINVSLDVLKKDSNIKRNALMLEDVISKRNHTSWLNKTTIQLNEDLWRNSPSKKGMSQSARHSNEQITIRF